MKYINTATELNSEFDRLLPAYEHYYWMVAWAGISFLHTDVLLRYSDKIRQLVVGLHFYQTAPAFIEIFNPLPGVRFIKQISGIFHSKVYLFVNAPDHWEVVVGSANFTKAAFSRNQEAGVLLRSHEVEPRLFQQIKDSIETAWLEGKKFTQPELEDYKKMANRSQEASDPLIPIGPRNHDFPKAISIEHLSWREYIDRIFQSGGGRIMERITLLDIVSAHFRRFPVFADMPSLQRKQVGGYIVAGQPVDFRLFGNMLNATTFTRLTNRDPTGISRALDVIPSEGPVTEVQFNSFVRQFETALGGGNKYRSGTRLLAMKRPDVFFALSMGNSTLVALDFDIQNISSMNFSRYWQEIVLPIQRSDWWLHPEPLTKAERSIASYRAAFLDAMYYQPPKTFL